MNTKKTTTVRMRVEDRDFFANISKLSITNNISIIADLLAHREEISILIADEMKKRSAIVRGVHNVGNEAWGKKDENNQ